MQLHCCWQWKGRFGRISLPFTRFWLKFWYVYRWKLELPYILSAIVLQTYISGIQHTAYWPLEFINSTINKLKHSIFHGSVLLFIWQIKSAVNCLLPLTLPLINLSTGKITSLIRAVAICGYTSSLLQQKILREN